MAEKYAVIGGEGFLGQAIVQQLIKKYGHDRVASLGPTQRTFDQDGYRYFRTDITSYDSVYSALRDSDCTCVFHTVSPHADSNMSACELINVQGTRNTVEACFALGARISKLVYTSSVTVSFDGTSNMKNIDERLPTMDASNDFYVKTKIEAERLVLEANDNGHSLKTCSIRCCGLFGPGDRQVMPGIIGVLKAKQTAFQLGYNDNLYDFMYIDNAAHAHLLAADKLVDAKVDMDDCYSRRLVPVQGSVPRRSIPTSRLDQEKPEPELRERDRPWFAAEPVDSIAGKAIVISNGEPVPFWSFLRACWAAYDDSFGRTTLTRTVVPIPVSLSMMMAHVSEWIAWCRGKKPSEAGLNVAHARFVLCDMWVDMERARRLIGYEPVVSLEQGIKRTIEWYKLDEQRKKS